MSLTGNSYHLFCDGACSGNPGPGGWGAILIAPDGQVREMGGAKSPTTNNQMELTAAIEGLKQIDGDGIVEIYTDSSYVINGITKWIHGWKAKGWKTAAGESVANKDLWMQLSDATSRVGWKRVRWNYVPGHQGIAGNERADAIAVGFAQNEPPQFYQGPLSDYSLRLLPVEKGTPTAKGKAKGKAAYYVSLVDGEVERHKTWAECEARVKGRPNAKYKKVNNEAEVTASLIAWNHPIR